MEGDLHLDGNALAGLLGELFVGELTAARRVCQSCGQRHAIGSHRLFTGAGYVLRCPGCGDVAACIAELPDGHVISLRGTWSIRRAG